MSSDDPLLDPVWNALQTVHSHFAVRNGPAVRYPADVVPYTALANADHTNLSPLAELLTPGELVYVIGAKPESPKPGSSKSIQIGPPLNCFQMIFPAQSQPNVASPDDASSETEIIRMTPQDAPAMVALTDLAFPGFFRPRTNEMGVYYGIRANGELVAMAGERLAVPGISEISAVCTHPAHTGKGHARLLMTRLLHDHADSGKRSFLHVNELNHHAFGIYQRMGFTVLRSVALWPISIS